MATAIKMKFEGENYDLEYSRDAVAEIERHGFNIQEIDTKPATMVPLLFEGAFIKNHRGIKRKLMDRIFDQIKGKRLFLETLSNMYVETVNSLFDDAEEDSENLGNAEWTKG